jgi:hypothetical protein
MANPKHVALVRRGEEAIAEWRKVHPRARLDLSGADLSGANLRKANLSGVDLDAADLEGSILTGANLRWAALTRANLTDANLAQANLSTADLRVANLVNADLREADLTWANLTWADLTTANLAGATFRLTLLNNVDLSKAIGLRLVKHLGQSFVGVDTLITSTREATSEVAPDLVSFLAHAGVPLGLLIALQLGATKISYHSCFISYGQPDIALATRLCRDLELRGVPCWMYELDKTPGRRTRREIGDARMGADKFVLLCSAATLVRDGVLEEIEDQINEDPERLVPISLDNLWKEPGFRIVRGAHDLKPDLVNRNYADFANKPYEEALAELLKGLRWPEVKKPRRSRKSS